MKYQVIKNREITYHNCNFVYHIRRMDNTIAYNKKDCNLENWKVDFLLKKFINTFSKIFSSYKIRHPTFQKTM